MNPTITQGEIERIDLQLIANSRNLRYSVSEKSRALYATQIDQLLDRRHSLQLPKEES